MNDCSYSCLGLFYLFWMWNFGGFRCDSIGFVFFFFFFFDKPIGFVFDNIRSGIKLRYGNLGAIH